MDRVADDHEVGSGERDPDRLSANMDTRGRQLVLQILDELGRLERH